MCTVSFLPTKEGCLITSNRDEIITRALAEPPAIASPKTSMLLFPRDPVGGGTWIASGTQATVCLFNGAFEPHKRKQSYRHSRGLIPVAFFEHNDAKDFVKAYDFKGIEPFSIVIYQADTLFEIKWDEHKAHLIEHDATVPHIWASVTLYAPEVRAKRSRMFREWLDSQPAFTQQSIVGFHTSEKTDTENGLMIDRANGLKTISVTSVHRVDNNDSNMVYHDLVNETKYVRDLKH